MENVVKLQGTGKEGERDWCDISEQRWREGRGWQRTDLHFHSNVTLEENPSLCEAVRTETAVPPGGIWLLLSNVTVEMYFRIYHATHRCVQLEESSLK